ncbi:MAG: hypothetical protein COV48_14505, partial [Elusimicrobia bacterium CG11_big_fil_rev_8_21_14_0_20_64_6]
LVFAGMTVAGGFPLPEDHLPPFIVMLMPPLAPAFEAALRSWGGEGRGRGSALARGLALAAGLAAVAIVGIKALSSTLPVAFARVSRLGIKTAVILRELRPRLSPGEIIILELPPWGRHGDPDSPAHADPRLAQLASLPWRVKLDRPFIYAQYPQTEDFRLDASQPSLFDAEPSALRERLERRRARILLVLTPRDGLRRAGWTAVG